MPAARASLLAAIAQKPAWKRHPPPGEILTPGTYLVDSRDVFLEIAEHLEASANVFLHRNRHGHASPGIALAQLLAGPTHQEGMARRDIACLQRIRIPVVDLETRP